MGRGARQRLPAVSSTSDRVLDPLTEVPWVRKGWQPEQTAYYSAQLEDGQRLLASLRAVPLALDEVWVRFEAQPERALPRRLVAITGVLEGRCELRRSAYGACAGYSRCIHELLVLQARTDGAFREMSDVRTIWPYRAEIGIGDFKSDVDFRAGHWIVLSLGGAFDSDVYASQVVIGHLVGDLWVQGANKSGRFETLRQITAGRCPCPLRSDCQHLRLLEGAKANHPELIEKIQSEVTS